MCVPFCVLSFHFKGYRYRSFVGVDTVVWMRSFVNHLYIYYSVCLSICQFISLSLPQFLFLSQYLPPSHLIAQSHKSRNGETEKWNRLVLLVLISQIKDKKNISDPDLYCFVFLLCVFVDYQISNDISDHNSTPDNPLALFTCLCTGLASLHYKLLLMPHTCHRRSFANMWSEFALVRLNV